MTATIMLQHPTKCPHCGRQINILFPPEGNICAVLHEPPTCDKKLIVNQDELRMAWREQRDARDVVRIFKETSADDGDGARSPDSQRGS